jgi:hypothetical protein
MGLSYVACGRGQDGPFGIAVDVYWAAQGGAVMKAPQ